MKGVRAPDLGPIWAQRPRRASQNACLIGDGDSIHAHFRPTDRSPPIWGSRGRRFKSRQPDNTMANCHAGSDPRSSGHRAIRDKPKCQPLALGRCDEHRARRVCSELVRLRAPRVREGTDTGNLRTCRKAQYLKITAWPSFGRQTLQTGVRCCKVLRGTFA